MTASGYLRKMREDWDERARRNARHFIADGAREWTEEEFYASGEINAAEEILTDMGNICQGRNPKQMRIFELGCGAARMTRALAGIFGEVHAVDVSADMVRQAQEALRGHPNAFVYQNDGMSLSVLGDLRFDFAYSCCVFHHISSYEVIQSYVSEVGKRLAPGALFKFEVQGSPDVAVRPGDTWLGAPFSLDRARRMAEDCGFELRYHTGAGQERFWLWCFKRGG
jgi:SAM-dependent methyltransferase